MIEIILSVNDENDGRPLTQELTEEDGRGMGFVFSSKFIQIQTPSIVIDDFHT